MAESPSQQPQSPTQLAPDTDSDEVVEYWCYQCDKRVNVETLADHSQIVCIDCKSGFVESIAPAPPSLTSDHGDDPSLGNQFIQVLNLLAQAARDTDVPPPPPLDGSDPPENDYLRIEVDGWDEDDDDDEEEENDEDNDNVEVHSDNVEEHEEEEENAENQGSGENEDPEERESEEDDRLARRAMLRRRLREFAARGTSRRNRILDWADILMGLEDHSIEFRLQGGDGYVGNPGDYVDAAGYEAVLRNLAETDGERRGAPPAKESAVEALKIIEIKSEKEALLCAVCKDLVNVGEVAKELPCGHGYHGDCIVPWLSSRNTCPVCRFELPTDDPDYEEERKKKSVANYSGGGGGSSSSGDYVSGLE